MAENTTSILGQRLRQGRLKQRLSISECAKRTHIATRYLEAIEEERWAVLPSASHRIGFLKIYSRFLGVPADEVLELYYQGVARTPTPDPASTTALRDRSRNTYGSGYPTSWQQVLVLGFVLLALAWALYHSFHNSASEARPLASWARLRPRPPRLVTPQTTTTIQRVRLQAQANSWVRVTEHGRLLYEGILPSGAIKNWSGTGPFLFKLGDLHAVALYWNDQPVDVQRNARGNVNELQLPLPK